MRNIMLPSSPRRPLAVGFFELARTRARWGPPGSPPRVAILIDHGGPFDADAALRDLAFQRLREKLEELNFVPKERKPTKTPKSAVRRRLADKQRRSERKEGRRPPRED